MAKPFIQRIIEDMGWTEGLRVPVANKENLNLIAEVERLTLAKAKATLAFEAINTKCGALANHLKHVQTEQEQNQQLLIARQSELKTEKEMYMTVKMDKEKTAQEIKTFNKEIDDTENRKQTKLKDLNDLVKKLDKLKATIEWDEDSIEDWENKLLQKQEDNDLLKKFSEEDKKKAKDLEIKRQRLQEEYTARHQLVVKTSKEIDSLELILKKNVQLYKQMHEERGNLVKQWQDAVKNLQQRDKDTLQVNREIIAMKELIEAKREILEQEKQFYQNEQNNNAELHVEISEGNNEVGRLRKDYQNVQNIYQNMSVELDAMKRELTRSADMLAQERVEIKNLFNDIVQKDKQLSILNLKVQHLKVQIKNVQETSLTANERVKQLEEIISNEESANKVLLVDIENMQNISYRNEKLLNELNDNYKVKHASVQGTEQGIGLLEKELQQLDKEMIGVKENRYKINFKTSMLMSRIMKMEGGTEDLDMVDFTQKQDELETRWKEVSDLNNLLQDQINKLEELMRSLSNSITSDTEKIERIKYKLEDEMLLVEGAKKKIKEKKDINHQHQVEENVMKVKLRHVEKQLKDEGNSIYNLQRQKLELETMMRERESEIKINKDILIIKRNSMQEDNSKLRQDIQARRIKIENLQKRLDCIYSSLGKTEDGETVSTSYVKVKMAQEKYMLQEEGDRLDNLIRNAEKEIIAMENTLKAINFSNDTVRKSLTLVDEPDDDINEMKDLEDELYAQTKILRQNRNQLKAQQEKLFEIQEELNRKQDIMDDLEKQISEKEEEYSLLENEAFHRRNKLERTDNLIKKVKTKEINEVQKRDFITRQLKDSNRSALQQLAETSTKHIVTQPAIKQYLEEKNLSLSTTSLRSPASSKSCSTYSYSTPVTNRSSIPTTSLELDIPKK